MLKIRSVLRSDIKRLYEIEKESFKAPFSFRRLEHLTKFKNIIYLVCESERKIVGYSITSLHDKEAHLISIVIQKDYRRRKFGTQLLEKNIEIVKGLEKYQIEKFLLEVRISNEAAKNFYSKFKFKPLRTKVQYYSDGEDAIEMVLILDELK